MLHVNSLQQPVNLKTLTMFMGARHALLHVTERSVQENRLRERKNCKLQSEKFTKNTQNLIFNKSYTQYKFIYLFMALFISFLVHNNAPCTFFMIFMEEG
jgi:hypothetical protein